MSPICSSIRPQKLPMHALSQQQARLDMDCRIPGSLGLFGCRREGQAPGPATCVQNGPLLHRDGAFAGKRHICLAVQDSGHADEALVHAWEVGDVGGDDLEGSAAPEVPVHGIGRHLGLPVLADRAAGPPALPLPHDAGLPHDALHLPAAQSAGRRA